MPEPKIELGRKPELDEVRVFGKALANAGKQKLVKDVKKYEAVKKKQGEDRDAALVAIGMSFCMEKTGEMLVRFVEGKIMNPLEAKDAMKEAFKTIAEDKEEDLDTKIANALTEDDDEEREFTEDDVEFAHRTIDQAYKKAAIKLMDKYGKKATVKFLSAYAQGFLNMVDDWEEDEITPEDIKKNGKEISPEELYKDLEENGQGDMVEKLKSLLDGDTEVRVFKCKVEKKKKD